MTTYSLARSLSGVRKGGGLAGYTGAVNAFVFT